MDASIEREKQILEFWDKRSQLGFLSGTNDKILKKLEIMELSKYIKDGMNILEVGCGNGITAIELSKRYNVSIDAIDFSSKMIDAANKNLSKENLKGRVEFKVLNVKQLYDISQKYDLIFCERVLINLANWNEQMNTIKIITSLLVKSGLFLMCENSFDALSRLNVLRIQVGLKKIEHPWHNCYFNEKDIEDLSIPNCVLYDIVNFTSTYYFISRIINAYLANIENKDPSYDSQINQIALRLSPIGDIGQTKLWIWKKLT